MKIKMSATTKRSFTIKLFITSLLHLVDYFVTPCLLLSQVIKTLMAKSSGEYMKSTTISYLWAVHKNCT